MKSVKLLSPFGPRSVLVLLSKVAMSQHPFPSASSDTNESCFQHEVSRGTDGFLVPAQGSNVPRVSADFAPVSDETRASPDCTDNYYLEFLYNR